MLSNRSFFCKLVALLAILLSFYFIKKGLNIDLDETKYHPIVLKYYYQLRVMHFSIAFVLVLKSSISFFVNNIGLRKMLALNLCIDIVCLFLAERAIAYFSTGVFMIPMIANIIVGIPLLIIFFNQIYYIYLLVIKRKRMHWEIGLEEILDSEN